jgi:tetratricopeptide (TPR) repeat protein
MIQKELRMALDVWNERLASDIYLIPVRLEECEVPEPLAVFQWVDLFSSDGWARLLMAIQVGRKRRAEVTKPKIVEAVRRNKQAMVKRMRGLIALQSNDLDGAEQNLQEALAIWQDLGFDKYIATSLGDLGQLAQKRKRYDAAERFYRQSVELARKIDDKEVQTVGLGYEGEFAIGIGKWTEAREWCEQALILARKIGHIVVIAQAQYGLACVHEAEGRADLALPPAQEALRIYQRLQHQDLAQARALVERLLKDEG